MMKTILRLEPGRRPVTKAQVAVESLEGRALLSHMAHPTQAQLASMASVQGLTVKPNPHIGPILNIVGPGFAAKSARIYPFYTGTPLTTLNVAAATARIFNGTDLVLTGQVVEPVVQKPSGPAQEAFYVWGVNRGGAPNPGPFPGRPNIRFDAAIVVAVQQSGTSVFVDDLATSKITPIDPGTVKIINGTIKLTVPLNLLPSTGASPSQYRVNFWAENTPFPSGPTSIESFVPEGRDFQVKVRG